MHDQDLILARPRRIPLAGAISYRLVSVLFGLLSMFLLGEIILRFILPSQDRFYVWPPHFESTLHPNSEILAGITGEALFRINSSGIRGDEFNDKQEYRILAVGGSTTECLSLDETEVWTHLVQERLFEAKGKPVWVGNIGRSGRNTRHHILQLKYLLPQLPKIDAVIVLAGVNDLHIRISDFKYDPQTTAKPTFEEEYMRGAFALSPPDLPSYHFKRLGWWRIAKNLKAAYLTDTSGQPIQDSTGETLDQWRRYRQNAEEIVDAMPDLTTALGEYRKNLAAIAGIAKRRSVRPILVTQPTIWREDLGQKEQNLLWMGGVGAFQMGKGHTYYSVSALDRIMREYNNATLDVCRDQRIDCIDLAAALPKDTTVFYDDVHFNESGARQVADVLFKYIDRQVLPN